MSPLSPFYYIFHDKKKTVGLIVLMMLELVVYFGILVYSVDFDFTEYINSDIPLVVLFPRYTIDETEQDSFEKFKEKIEREQRLDLIEFNFGEYYSWNTIFSGVSNNWVLTFSSVESFEEYCARTGISCDTSVLKDGSIIMSKMLAKNNGINIGDTIDDKVFPDFHEIYTFDVMTDEKGYKAYAINENVDSEMIMIFPSDGKSFDIIEKITEEYIGDLKNKVFLMNGTGYFSMVGMSSFVMSLINLVFYSLALSIMINAVFTGAYQTRSFEFALYKAVGIRKRKIVWKIFSEIVCIQLLALIIGGIILFTFLYLFNNIVLYPQGKYISYYSQYALAFLAGVVLTVNIPLIISRIFQVLTVKIRNY